MNIIKERAHRIVVSDPAYKTEEAKYLRSVMKGLPQEELILHLGTLNYIELKAVVGCGVPGHAQNKALQLLKEKRDALDMFISEGGIEAVVGTEVEEPKEETKDGDEGVCTSETKREGDSGTMGEESTDSGNA